MLRGVRDARTARTATRATRLDTIVALTSSDLRARYGRGRARVVKWLLDPFFAVGVYLVLVTVVLDRPGEAPGLSIACAVVPFQLVITSITNGIGTIQVRRSILLNMSFDRMLLPLASVLTETIALAQVPESARGWLAINPLTGLFEAYRAVLLYGHRPAAWELLVPVTWTVAILLAVLPLYRSEQRQLAKMVEEE